MNLANRSKGYLRILIIWTIIKMVILACACLLMAAVALSLTTLSVPIILLIILSWLVTSPPVRFDRREYFLRWWW